jgi:hypothetical protein
MSRANGVEEEETTLNVRDLAHLETVLAEVVIGGAGLGVEVIPACGAVEVRVSGPSAALTFRFDRTELQPAHVLRIVGRAVARYRSSLGPAAFATRQ